MNLSDKTEINAAPILAVVHEVLEAFFYFIMAKVGVLTWYNLALH